MRANAGITPATWHRLPAGGMPLLRLASLVASAKPAGRPGEADSSVTERKTRSQASAKTPADC